MEFLDGYKTDAKWKSGFGTVESTSGRVIRLAWVFEEHSSAGLSYWNCMNVQKSNMEMPN